MGVTVLTTLGVGFKVTEGDAEAFFDPGEVMERGVYDLLDEFVYTEHPLLGLVLGGSGYSGDFEYAIAVRRLNRNLDAYRDVGVFGLEKPVLHLEETIALADAGAKLLGRAPDVGQFVAMYVG